MKRVVSLVIVFIVLLAGAGCQQSSPELQTAAYQSDEDMYIVFRGSIFKNLASWLPAEVLGDIAFKLQEGTHASIKDVSQVEIDHYYIWVCIENDCVPVDPFRYSN